MINFKANEITDNKVTIYLNIEVTGIGKEEEITLIPSKYKASKLSEIIATYILDVNLKKIKDVTEDDISISVVNGIPYIKFSESIIGEYVRLALIYNVKSSDHI